VTRKSLAEHPHARRIDPGLLARLAQRGAHRALAASLESIDPAAGERRLACVRAHIRGALGDQHVRAVRQRVGEQDEHGGRVRIAGQRRGAAQQRTAEVVIAGLDRGDRGDQRMQPFGQVGELFGEFWGG